jgi:hypothetical protein
MNCIKKIALAALCSAAFASPTAMANLVADAGFELDNGSWALTGWGLANFDRGTHSGSNSIGTFCSDPDFTACTFSQSLVTTPGAMYDISFWLYADGLAGEADTNIPNGLQVSFDGVVVNTIMNFPSTNPGVLDFSPGGLSTLITINNVLATTNSTELQFGGFSTPSSIFVDDVNVSAIPEPTSLALLAAGLVGLGYYRGKKA